MIMEMQSLWIIWAKRHTCWSYRGSYSPSKSTTTTTTSVTTSTSSYNCATDPSAQCSEYTAQHESLTTSQQADLLTGAFYAGTVLVAVFGGDEVLPYLVEGDFTMTTYDIDYGSKATPQGAFGAFLAGVLGEYIREYS